MYGAHHSVHGLVCTRGPYVPIGPVVRERGDGHAYKGKMERRRKAGQAEVVGRMAMAGARRWQSRRDRKAEDDRMENGGEEDLLVVQEAG